MSSPVVQAQQVYLTATNPNGPTHDGYTKLGNFGYDNGSYFAACGGVNPPCAYNGYGYGGTGLSNSNPFVFNGGFFRTATYMSSTPATSIYFLGSDGTNSYTSGSCSLSTTAFVYCANTFNAPITRLFFVTSGGTDAYGGTTGGGYYLANTLTFNGPVSTSTTPEPGTIVLLATGLLGLVPAARRRR